MHSLLIPVVPKLCVAAPRGVANFSKGRRDILKRLFEMHLTQLNVHFAMYFTEDVDKFKLVKDPSNTEAEAPSHLSTGEQELLIFVGSWIFCDGCYKNQVVPVKVKC